MTAPIQLDEKTAELVARMLRGDVLTDDELATVRAAVDPDPDGLLGIIATRIRLFDVENTDGPGLPPLSDYLEDATDLATQVYVYLVDRVNRLHHPTRLDGEVWLNRDDVIALLDEELTP